jgi:thiosulfate/3-mercaptopyruvate sulfurtransferase
MCGEPDLVDIKLNPCIYSISYLKMASRALNRFLLETHELNQLLLQRTNLHILDTTLIRATFDAKQAHFKARIPGAKYFDISEIADTKSTLPYMLPSDNVFISYMKRLRIPQDGKLVVCYDQQGIFSSPRVWYTLSIFGRENVMVLNGGLNKWLKENHSIDSGEYPIYVEPESEDNLQYSYSLNKDKVKVYKNVKTVSDAIEQGKEKKVQILDARANLSAGQIPGAISVPYTKLIDSKGCMKTPEDLKKIYEDSKVSLSNDTHIINSCAGGVTACINILGLELCGKTNTSLYDGSWAEYVIYIQRTKSKEA